MSNQKSSNRVDLAYVNRKWYVYDFFIPEVKAGPFTTMKEAKSALAIFKSRRRYTISDRHWAELGFGTKYPGGQKPHNPKYVSHGVAGQKKAKRPKYKVNALGVRQLKRVQSPRVRTIAKRTYQLPNVVPVFGESALDFLPSVVGNPPLTKIYGRVLRVEAQKTGPHLCDAKCKAAGHRYFHNFTTRPGLYGTPNKRVLIIK